MRNRFTWPKLTLLTVACSLSLAWLALNLKYFITTQNGLVRLVLGLAFCLLIILRKKPENDDEQKTIYHNSAFPITTACLGATLALSGIVFKINHAEWIGILLLIAGTLAWSLPHTYTKDILRSMLVLYWIHPLPGTVFGPMQIALQKFSVAASECLLHTLNVRVWADGMILRTGLNIYEIPSWCSGMRTATTVFILTLALGILKRLRWYHCALALILAVVQTLILNVIRISIMVLAGPFSETDSHVDFLHDATGIIIILSVVLIWIEISLLHKRELELKSARTIPNWKFLRQFSSQPPFWRIITHHRGKVILTIILLLIAGITAYKRRPYHRAEMIKPVCEMLLSSGDLENAERAAMAVMEHVPKDREWFVVIARIYIIRGKYKEALDFVPKIPEGDKNRSIEKDILTAYSHLGLGEIEKTTTALARIPDEVKSTSPLVAMVMAELEVFRNKPERVAKYLAVASQWEPNIERVRSVYPYLRRHRKWDAIRQTDNEEIPYHNIDQALCALDAYINMNDAPSIAALTLESVNKWPTDLRLLTPIFFMAIKGDNADWEKRLEAHLRRSVQASTDPDMIYPQIENCFKIARPDLAWIIYSRIKQLDSSHPSLMLIAAQYGKIWFQFRKQFLGINTGNTTERIDIRPLIRMAKLIPSWREKVSKIPLIDELSSFNLMPTQKNFIKKAIQEFELRAKNKNLSNYMQAEYIRALLMDEQHKLAAQMLHDSDLNLSQIAQKSILSEISMSNNDWQNVYEALHDLLEYDGTPPLNLIIRLSEAQRALRLGIAAIHSATEAVRIYPESQSATRNLAMTLMAFDSPEEALLVLNRDLPFYSRELQLLKAQVLHKSQRFKAAEEVCRNNLIPPIRIEPYTKQSLLLTPAELSIHYHVSATPSPEAFDSTAKKLEHNLKRTDNPFLRNLLNQWLNAYSAKNTDSDAFSIGVWTSLGRNNSEKAVSLHQLAMLLCHKNDFDKARKAVDKSLNYLPDSTILWRMLISLSNADTQTIAQARKNCPNSSEIWLAELVALARSDLPPEQSKEYDSKNLPYSAATLTRGAEYLFRSGNQKLACQLAKQVTAKAQSLLPAYVMGVRCALHQKDEEWALKAVNGCIESALADLPAFYETLVDLKRDGYAINSDPSMRDALKKLREQDPQNRLWAEMLGYVNFNRGGDGLIDAMFHLTEAIEAGSTNKFVFLLAGETARQLGNLENAVAILETGYHLYPQDKTILNNLIYTLAQSETTAQEAIKYLPQLLKIDNSDPNVLDTASEALLKAGLLDRSEETINVLLKKYSHIPKYWFRSNMHLADIAIRRENYAKAKTLLTEILKNTKSIEDESIKKANKLMEYLELKTGENSAE